MNTATYDIHVQLTNLGDYSISELTEKIMAYAKTLVSTSHQETVTAKKEHSAWVKSMEKYRKLKPMNDKDELLEALDERFQ